jgi:hypothetical protein
MLVAKKVADLITAARGLFAIWFAWLGWDQGSLGLPLAVWSLIAAWTGDAVDGPIARRSQEYYRTWLGDHDLEVDIAVSVGLMVYMLQSGFLDLGVAAGYLLVWVLILWHWGFQRSLGMLIQAPIYLWFVWISITRVPSVGWWLVVWIGAVVLLTWPRFPQEVVPGFLEGMQSVWKGYNRFRE